MSHARKNDVLMNYASETWRPSASLGQLKTRAAILQQVRAFFAARQVMEVETPLMCHTSVTDPYIQSIKALLNKDGCEQRYYLQTSPEYAMKRILSAGSGPIYQICKAFRQDEIGRYHNPEFTILEWYQLHFDHHDLMDEVDDFLQIILKVDKAERFTYQALFLNYLQIDPYSADIETLKACAKLNNIEVQGEITDRDTWLMLLMSHVIEPQIGEKVPCFIYDFPASQASLARIQPGNPEVASRFEVYFRGIELANGFHELQNEAEQRARFNNNLLLREQMNLPLLPLDENFLNALSHGLPDCAGVAMGIDRLVMLATQSAELSDTLSFDFKRV